MIQVFTRPGCPPCNGTKRELDKLGIEYEQFDVTVDESAVATVQRLGYSTVPVVYVDGDTHWAGFRPDRIAELQR